MNEKENEKVKTPRNGSKTKKTGFYAALYSCVGLMLATAVIIGFNRLGGPQTVGDGSDEARATPPAATARPTPGAENRQPTPAPDATQTPEGQAPAINGQQATPAPNRPATQATPQPAPQPNRPTGQLPDDDTYIERCDCCDSELAEVFAPGTPGDAEADGAGDAETTGNPWLDLLNQTGGSEWDEECLDCCLYEQLAQQTQQQAGRDYGFDAFAHYHRMTWPVNGEVIMEYNSSGLVFNPTLNSWRTNYNIAIAAPKDAEVQAAAAGRVTAVTNTREMGNKVVIEHGNGWVTTYGQLRSDVRVSAGDVVSRGQVIGYVYEPTISSSGLAPHVAFQVLHEEATVNPLTVLMDR